MLESIERLGKKYNVSTSTATKIIWCESRNYPYATGTQAVVGIDVGFWQINTYYHEESAKKLGYDIYSPEDNLEFGFRLMATQGTKPWNWSKEVCWNK